MDFGSGWNAALRMPGAGVRKAFVPALFARPAKLDPLASALPPMPEVMPQPVAPPVLDHPLRLEPPGGGLAPSARLSLRVRFLARRGEGDAPESLRSAAEKESALFALLEAHLSSAQHVRAAVARGR